MTFWEPKQLCFPSPKSSKKICSCKLHIFSNKTQYLMSFIDGYVHNFANFQTFFNLSLTNPLNISPILFTILWMSSNHRPCWLENVFIIHLTNILKKANLTPNYKDLTKLYPTDWKFYYHCGYNLGYEDSKHPLSHSIQ